MSQIFLSYSSLDRERVLTLVKALQDDGYTVWWDREIRPGPSFDREIEREIGEAGCIVVVWSESSVESEWVRAEVEEGARRGLLVPVLIDDVLPPLAHRRRQAANLMDWDGERDGEYAKLIAGIEATLAGENPVREPGDPIPAHVTPTPRRRRRAFGITALAAVAVVALLVGIAGTYAFVHRDAQALPPRHETRFSFELPANLTLTNHVAYPIMITPDGRTIVLNTTDITGKQGTRYFSRPLDSLTAKPIEGVQSHQMTGLGSLWRGPLGEWFIYNDPIAKLYKKQRIEGGTPIPIASTNLGATGIQGLDWAPNGDIVFANTANPALMLLKGGAGTAAPLTHPAEGMYDEDPRFTPDGKAVLYDQRKKDTSVKDYAPQVMVLDIASGKSNKLLEGEGARVTTSGHLLFERNHVIWASAFDRQSLTVYGKQTPMLEGLATGMNAWVVSDNGTLAYVPAISGSQVDTRMEWMSFDGKVEPVPSFQRNMLVPALSPDNRHMAVTVPGEGNDEASIWVYAFDKQIASRLTFNDDLAVQPAWSPDGKEITYTEGQAFPNFDIMIRRADGTGEARQITKGAGAVYPEFTPDGKAIVFSNCAKQCDLAMVSLDEGKAGKATVKVLFKTDFNERAAKVSPDGRWIAYSSDASGQEEIFVRPWPNVSEGRWQVSNNGGGAPMWSSDGARLYYVQPVSNELMSVTIDGGKQFSAGRPTRVADFSGYDWQGPGGGANFAISNDEKRVLAMKSTPNNKIVVVLNWLEEVKRLVPVKP